MVVSLIDLNTGKEIDSETSVNPQKEYGLDVLSRIDFVKKKGKWSLSIAKGHSRLYKFSIKKSMP